MTSANDQIPLPPDIIPLSSDIEARGSEAPWLGLVTDHRRLFDALQDGWLRPLEPPAGVLVGIGKYASEQSPASAGHPILVRMKLGRGEVGGEVARFRCPRFP